jgi:hypothetical protein
VCSQERGYHRLTVDIETIEGHSIKCETYQMDDTHLKQLPSPYYKDVIVRGAHQHSLPRHYLKQLETVQHNHYNGHVPNVYQIIMQKLEMEKKDDI